ncbi:MAG: primosomal protein N', partial [Thermoleophilaceae bacterium]|nr:primosomal protein N' [Thermoleophilaceae bacterium]
FALVAQLAGRSGRGERGGWVIVQALDPTARALGYAARHDSDGFLEGELARRAMLSYPPHGHLIRVVCSCEETGPEGAAAEAIKAAIQVPGASVLGPAPLFRRQGRDRAQLVIRAPTDGGPARSEVIDAVRRAVETVAGDRAHGAVAFAVDVDPQ